MCGKPFTHDEIQKSLDCESRPAPLCLKLCDSQPWEPLLGASETLK